MFQEGCLSTALFYPIISLFLGTRKGVVDARRTRNPERSVTGSCRHPLVPLMLLGTGKARVSGPELIVILVGY